jgi:16S rRNA (cytosine1402-N4)-methyltransferase
MAHTSVLLQEIIDGLDIQKGDVVVDATTNGGGMSKEVVRRFGTAIQLYCIDADEDALSRAKENIGPDAHYIQGNFGDIKELLQKERLQKIDRAMFDLGLSSDQLADSGRGFSFQKNEPLLMTFKKNPSEHDLTAKDIVNGWDEENIETILRAYGEESWARKIARAIVAARTIKKIETSGELAAIIEKAVPRRGKIHPATKTFQAIRMAVNNEIENIKRGIKDAFDMLASKGRIAVISFHSLEDRTVKNFIKDQVREGTGKAITKKPLKPTEREVEANPRSRSAKLRIIEKI